MELWAHQHTLSPGRGLRCYLSRSILRPWVGVDSSKAHSRAIVFGNTTLYTEAEVEITDEDLVLACVGEGAEPPGTSTERVSTSLS
jgi:hypothetical protein